MPHRWKARAAVNGSRRETRLDYIVVPKSRQHAMQPEARPSPAEKAAARRDIDRQHRNYSPCVQTESARHPTLLPPSRAPEPASP